MQLHPGPLKKERKMELKSYGTERYCPKCGNRKIDATYVSEKDSKEADAWDLDVLVPGEEHMIRCCRTCHYTWAEKPLDA